MPGYGAIASYPICGPDALGAAVTAPSGGASGRARTPVHHQVVHGRLAVVAAAALVAIDGQHQAQIQGQLAVTAATARMAMRGRSEDEERWLLGGDVMQWLIGFSDE